MILPMHRVEIVALKEVFPRVLAFLHERGVLHITPMADVPAPLRGRLARVRLSEDADRDRTRLEAMVTAIDDLLGPEAREPLSDRVAMAGREPTDALHARFTTLIQDLHRLRDHLAHLRDDLRMLPHYERLVEAFLSIKYAFAHRVDWAMVGLILEKRWEQDIGSLREEIARVTRGRMELSVATLDADRLAAIVFYDTRFEKDLEALIWGKGVDRIVLPDAYLGKPLEEVLGLIAERQRVLPPAIADAEAAYRRTLQEETPDLSVLRAVSRDRLRELMTSTAFVQSHYTVAITGWVPEPEIRALQAGLAGQFGGSAFVTIRPPRADERATVPVALDNPRPARPFELLLLPVRYPRYGTLDPTVLLALFFPLFFGLMVGDIGYGLVIAAGGLVLRRWMPRLPASASTLVLTMGGSAVVFGILFGELFGNLGKGWLHPLLFDRAEHMVLFLAIALGIGVVHVFLGFTLGIIQALRLRHGKHAAERAATMGALFGSLVLLGAAARVLPASLFTPGLVLLLAMIPVLIYAGGFIAVLELISAAGNILSYARLMALGLAGFMLAYVANTFATVLGNLVLGVIVATMMHLLNLAMSTFSPTVQALRLHYVEFFSKFYEPGGVPYAPFRREGGNDRWRSSG